MSNNPPPFKQLEVCNWVNTIVRLHEQVFTVNASSMLSPCYAAGHPPPAKRKEKRNPIIGRGYFKPLPDMNRYPSLTKAKGDLTPAYGYAAHVAEVEVDTSTGKVNVVNLAAYHDCDFP